MDHGERHLEGVLRNDQMYYHPLCYIVYVVLTGFMVLDR